MDTDLQPLPPRPRLTWKGTGIAALLWLVYALLYTGLIVGRTGYTFVHVLPGEILDHTVLALMSVPVWLLAVRRLDAASWGWKILVHAVVGPVYAWLGLQLMLWGSEGQGRQEILVNAQWIYFGLLTLYVLQFALYHMVRSVQRLRWREEQAARLLALARDRELAALKAQINPHFLFNALNAISAMAGRDTEATRDIVAQLADLLRYALDSADHQWVTLRDEVRFARAYLDLEAHRFADRLHVAYDVDETALDARVPPMVLQPLVDNAIKHGVGPRERGGTITLTARRAGAHVEVSVEDSGEGAAAGSQKGGIGLANTSARLEMLFGPEAALQRESIAPHGFRVSFRIPWTGSERGDTGHADGAEDEAERHVRADHAPA